MSNLNSQSASPAQPGNLFPKSHETNLLMQAMFEDAIAVFKDIAAKYAEVCARLSILPQTDSVISADNVEKPVEIQKKTSIRFGRPVRFSKPVLSFKRSCRKRKRALYCRRHPIFPLSLPVCFTQ
jgi:hypothetical protein